MPMQAKSACFSKWGCSAVVADVLVMVDLCNRMEFPLREFIERSVGPGAYYRNRARQLLDFKLPVFRPWTEAEIEKSKQTPFRVDFIAYEEVGICIGHHRGLANVDFE